MTCNCSGNGDMLTIDELSAYINISRAVLYKGVRENSLGIPYIRINKAVRFLRTDVAMWVNMFRKNTGTAVVEALEVAKADDGNSK